MYLILYMSEDTEQEKSQDELEYEKYIKQFNELQAKEEEIKILKEQTRGIVLFLKDKLSK